MAATPLIGCVLFEPGPRVIGPVHFGGSSMTRPLFCSHAFAHGALLLALSGLTACGGDSESLSRVAAALGSSNDLAQVRDIENHRLLGDARLKVYLHASAPATLEAAAMAAGRIGDASLQPDVLALLQHP